MSRLSSIPSSRTRRRRATQLVECLEPRTLLSSVLYTNIPNLNDGSSTVQAQFAAYDNSGSLWVINYGNPAGLSLDKVVNGAVTASIDVSAAVPTSLTAGPGGVFYMADLFGGIDVVNTTDANPTVQSYFFGDFTDTPANLTVASDGAVWFTVANTGPGTFGGVGRWTPGSASADYVDLGLPSTSTGTAISASDDGSVWVGVSGVNSNTNQLFKVSDTAGFAYGSLTVHSGGTFSWVEAPVNSDHADANANGYLDSVASDDGGGVWYALSNITTNSPRTARGPDTIAHYTSAGETTYTVPGAAAATPLNVRGLAFDGNGNLWFAELEGAQAGYLADGAFSMTNYADTGAVGPTVLAANPLDSEATVLTLGTLEAPQYGILTITAESTPVTFSGSANSFTIQEAKAVASDTLLATFEAPVPQTGYTVTIDWGDHTFTTMTPTLVPGSTDTYAVIVSGKIYATQGGYDGSVTVNDGTSTTGTMSFTATVSDTPLDVTSLTVTPLILRFVTVVGSFTDDAGLPTSTWHATINWGDTTSSAGLIVRDPTLPGRYFVLSFHQYRTRGTYHVQMTVTTSETNHAVTDSSLTTTVSVR